jgi:carbon monoxide dehydrogenase subunit G
VTVEESIHIGRAPEFVFAIVRDLERGPEWQESLESVDVQAGTEVRRVAGGRQEARFLIVEDDPPRRLAIASEGGPAKARASFDLEPQGDGTRVVFTLDVALRGAARLASGMVRPVVDRETKASLARLKELAEAGS